MCGEDSNSRTQVTQLTEWGQTSHSYISYPICGNLVLIPLSLWYKNVTKEEQDAWNNAFAAGLKKMIDDFESQNLNIDL